MLIKSTLRRRLVTFLPKNYRKIVVDRLFQQGIKVHPNTVSNVLEGRSENEAVAYELLQLYNERKKSIGRFRRAAGAILPQAA